MLRSGLSSAAGLASLAMATVPKRTLVRSISIAASSVSRRSAFSRQQVSLKPSWTIARSFASLPAGAQELKMPALSPTMTQGNVAKWKKNVGDRVKVGDSLCEIETDKATLEFESQEEGYIAKIFVNDGTPDVLCGRTLAIMVASPADIPSVADFVPIDASAAPAPKVEAKAAAPSTPAPAAPSAPAPSSSSAPSGGRVFASPLAKKLAGEMGVNLSAVQGSGPNNRVVKADVLEFAANKPAVVAAAPSVAAPAAPSVAAPVEFTTPYSEVPLSTVRKVIASRLLESKRNIPHFYLTVEVRLDELLRVRSKLNAQGEGKYKLSVNDFIVKASALALRKIPTVNSSWTDTAIRQYHNVDISVAVQTENGLITPIVKDADKLGVAGISSAVKSLADKARQGKLQPAEFQGGTFTISNLGMFGVKSFSAIINPPQSCILAVGAAEKKAVVVEKDGETRFEAATVMNVTLSCDHRTVDGVVGAQWLDAFKNIVENPLSMLL